MALIKMFFKLLALPLMLAVTIIQWVGIFFTSFSAIIFNLLAGLIFLITVIGFVFGITAGAEAVKMLKVDRLHMIAAITPDYETKKFFFNLASKLSVDASDEWYHCFFQTLRQEMDGYYDAEMTMKLAEVSIYDLEDDYGETDEV